jgi:hypothetical protein
MSVRHIRNFDALRPLTHELACADDEDADIDFSAVGLYLAGFQVFFAVLSCASVSVLACWVLPTPAVSAVRTLALMAVVGTLLIMKPLRVGRPRGVATVFNALRPSVAIYIAALVLEQLVHTCVLPENALEGGTLRRSIFHGATGVLLVAGLIRARSPRAESDLPFLLATFALLVLAIVPPPAVSHTGPLCEPASLLAAGERTLRAALFASVYAVLAYAAAPRRNASDETFVCAGRATAGSVWVLACTSWMLLFAPVQVVIALFARLAEEDDSVLPASSAGKFEAVPLKGAMTPELGTSDVESGELEPSGGEALVPVTLKSGLRFELGSQPNVCGVVAAVPASGRIVNGHAQGRDGGSSGIANMSSAALAEVVARESAIGS